jgi:hypothetical protein
MTLEEVASTLVLMTTRDNDPIKEIATSTSELLQFMIEVLEQEVEDEDVAVFNEVTVHDVTLEDGRSKAINFEYFDPVLGDCVYSLEIGDMVYDDATDTFKRAIYGYSNDMDTEDDKSVLRAVLNNFVNEVTIVD